MFAIASIVSGVRFAGLDGFILLFTASTILAAWVLTRAERSAAPATVEPSPGRINLPRPALPGGSGRLMTAGLLLAALALAAFGELSFKPDWSAKPALIVSTCALLLAIGGGELARALALAQERRAALRVGTGALLIAAGQLVATQLSPVLVRLGFSGRLTRFFRFDAPNVDNCLFALALYALGIVFVARGAGGLFTGIEPPTEVPEPPIAQSARVRGWLALAAALFVPTLYELHHGRYAAWELVAWLGSLALFAMAMRRLDRGRGVAARIAFTWFDAALLALLLAVGAGIALHRLATVPDSLMGDEGRFWETAAAIANGDFHPRIFDAGVYTFPMMSSYVQGWLMRAAGVTLWGWRFSSVAPALLAVVPTYFLARDLFGRRVAVVSGGLLVTSPYFLAFARLGYNNSQALAPVAAAIWLAAIGLRRGSLFLMALSGLAAGAGFYTYGGGRLAAMVVPVYCLTLAATRRGAVAGPGLGRLFAAFVAGGFGMAGPLVVYGSAVDPVDFRSKTLEAVFPNLVYARSLYSDAALFRDHGPITIDQSQIFFRPDLYVAMIGRGMFESAMAFVDKSFIHEHFIAAPLSGPIGAVLLAVGLGAALSRPLRAKAAIVVWWLAVGFLALAALDSFPPRQAHLVPVIPAIAILSGLGIVTLAEQSARLVSRRRDWLAAGLAVAVLTAVGFLGARNYFVAMPARYQPDLENVAIFTAQAATGPETLLWVNATPDQLDYIPWGIEHLPSQATFKNIDAADLMVSVNALAPGTRCTVFWTTASNDAVVPALRRLTGAPVSPTVHTLFGGEVSGYSFAFTTPSRP